MDPMKMPFWIKGNFLLRTLKGFLLFFRKFLKLYIYNCELQRNCDK